MGEPIRIAKGILVPEGGIEWRAVRSSGPGGPERQQGRLEGGAAGATSTSVSGLTAPARARLAAFAAGRLDADGRLLVTSQRTRDQFRNLEDARDKVKKLVERALKAPRPRRLTQPGRGAVERRLKAKRVRSGVKRVRKVALDDE